MDAIALDKKVAAKRLRWVLLREIGEPVLRSDIPPELVREVVTPLVS
jgi:3-dehydroquinate synthetase